MNKISYTLTVIILILCGIIVWQAQQIRTLTNPPKHEMTGVDFTSDITATDTVNTEDIIDIKMTVNV